MAALNYNHLRYFWAVAHDGNLTRTAERLNLTQSALSCKSANWRSAWATRCSNAAGDNCT
ncbi:hypothetical protein XAP7430_1120009 [Xanthomonas phaseoli pv. phaseoli]|uniref:HTH lysR-type domain-containing protein n=1 Tax=Xanthomonas campestris pv. phaseoli TaxID=317013 RepID=A0AB38DV28_XANCH|nr:hypothetical protein XAP6984_1150009 [Xanthomonas phaseoli pv. phaseoli]SON79798.1 hypothetical protein XAP7430_1120009 [Xanthomonas phaseoli pv. phaseoli]